MIEGFESQERWEHTSKNFEAMSSYTALCFANSRAIFNLQRRNQSSLVRDIRLFTYSGSRMPSRPSHRPGVMFHRWEAPPIDWTHQYYQVPGTRLQTRYVHPDLFCWPTWVEGMRTEVNISNKKDAPCEIQKQFLENTFKEGNIFSSM